GFVASEHGSFDSKDVLFHDSRPQWYDCQSVRLYGILHRSMLADLVFSCVVSVPCRQQKGSRAARETLDPVLHEGWKRQKPCIKMQSVCPGNREFLFAVE